MEILVIDRESLTNQLIASKLEAKGHKVTVEPGKNQAFEMIKAGNFDCIMLDPAPLSEARPVVIGVWKNTRTAVKPYLLLLAKEGSTETALLAGTNDVLNKPLSTLDLETKIGNAERLQDITRKLAREDNVHSVGGVIGKAAFNQLFLSAIDRAFRYAERSLLVFVSITNVDDMNKILGQETVDDTMKKLTEKMTFMRRQSDVIGRLGFKDFAILLQRPQYESEPIDAINRFTEVLEKFAASFENRDAAPRLTLSLVELPQGMKHTERFIPQAVAADTAQNAT